MMDRSKNYFQGELRQRPKQNFYPSRPARSAMVSSVLKRNQDLLRNAGSLAATTGVTSILGFAYWIYAARVFSTEAVGYGAAAISTMMLLGTIGMFGLDTMLIGELSRTANRGGLMMASCITAFAASFLFGLLFSLISLAFPGHFVEVNGTPGRMAVFSFGVAITGATLVLDAGTIGLLRGGIQLSRNVAVSVAKMATLPAAALVLHDRFGIGIMLAWVTGTILSLIPVALMIKRGGGRILYRPDWAILWNLRKLALAHNWLNLAINIPAKLIAVLVAIVVPPAANGAYYIANMIFSFLIMVPTSLSTVLFAVASASPKKIPDKLRFVLRMSLIIGIPGGLAIVVGAHSLLSIFGSSYADLATGPLCVLTLTYIPGLPNNVYIAVARVQGRFNQAAILLTAFAAFRMLALLVGGKMAGLYGLSYGMLAVQLVQAMITTPTVLRATRGSLTVGSAADPAGEYQLESSEPPEELRLRQEAGLAALIALATRVNSPMPWPDAGTMGMSSRMWSTSPAPRWTANGQSGQQSRNIVAVTRAEAALTDELLARLRRHDLPFKAGDGGWRR